jgi:hypothetical protein
VQGKKATSQPKQFLQWRDNPTFQSVTLLFTINAFTIADNDTVQAIPIAESTIKSAC